MKHLMWPHGVNPMVIPNGIPVESLRAGRPCRRAGHRPGRGDALPDLQDRPLQPRQALAPEPRRHRRAARPRPARAAADARRHRALRPRRARPRAPARAAGRRLERAHRRAGRHRPLARGDRGRRGGQPAPLPPRVRAPGHLRGRRRRCSPTPATSRSGWWGSRRWRRAASPWSAPPARSTRGRTATPSWSRRPRAPSWPAPWPASSSARSCRRGCARRLDATPPTSRGRRSSTASSSGCATWRRRQHVAGLNGTAPLPRGRVEVREVDLDEITELRARVLRSHMPGAPATAPSDEHADVLAPRGVPRGPAGGRGHGLRRGGAGPPGLPAAALPVHGRGAVRAGQRRGHRADGGAGARGRGSAAGGCSGPTGATAPSTSTGRLGFDVVGEAFDEPRRPAPPRGHPRAVSARRLDVGHQRIGCGGGRAPADLDRRRARRHRGGAA